MTSNTSRSSRERPKDGTVTRMSPQRSSAERISIYLDDRYAFSLSVNSLSEHPISIDEHLSRSDVERLTRADEPDRAITAALHLLAHRGRSEHELRDRLRRKGYMQPAIDRAIERVFEWGYLDDDQFAATWVEQRSIGRPRSRKALAWELKQKGVDRDIVERTVDDADIDELADARRLASDKWRKDRSQPLDRRRRRTGNYLARRGYGWNIARQVIDELVELDSAGQDH